MFKILRTSDKGSVVLSLSGRIEECDLPDLQSALAAEPHDSTLDLGEVRLAHRGALVFLANCKANGIKLKNCPAYISEWLATGSRAIDGDPYG